MNAGLQIITTIMVSHGSAQSLSACFEELQERVILGYWGQYGYKRNSEQGQLWYQGSEGPAYLQKLVLVEVKIDREGVQYTAAAREEDQDDKQPLVAVAAAVAVYSLFGLAISLSFIEHCSRRRGWQVLIPQYAHQPHTEAFMRYSQLYQANTAQLLLLIFL